MLCTTTTKVDGHRHRHKPSCHITNDHNDNEHDNEEDEEVNQMERTTEVSESGMFLFIRFLISPNDFFTDRLHYKWDMRGKREE
jgi:hypothetical protein